METTNSTTTSISDSSPPAGTSTSSTGFNAPLTSSAVLRSPDPGLHTDAKTTATETVTYSTPTTSTLTTIDPIAGSHPTVIPSSPSLSAVDTLTRQTIATLTGDIPSSTTSNGSSSGTISSGSNSQRQTTLPAFIVIGLVVASVIAGSWYIFRRRRHRLQKKDVEHDFQRPESTASFMDTDPFVCASQSPVPIMRSPAEEEVHRMMSHSILNGTKASNWWDTVGGPLVVKPYPRKPRSVDNERQQSANVPCVPAIYPSILFEQDEINGGEERLLRHDTTEQNLYEALDPMAIQYPTPPRRPPRSPRRKSKGSTRPSLDSLSTAHSISPSLLHRLPEKTLDGLPYDGTPLKVQKKSSTLL